MSYAENPTRPVGKSPEATLASAVSDLESLKERIHNAAKRVSQCADIIGGSKPHDAVAGDAAKQPTSAALTHQLYRHRQDFVGLLDALESEIGRLEVSING